MKIALADLNHMTAGVHNNTVPLGLGFIARYLRKTVKDPLEIKIFKDPNKALDVFDSWQPDILGIAQYCWNSVLNLHLAEMIKKRNPKCLVVAGGPNLDNTENSRVRFFQDNPFVDLCVAYDGEIPFSEIVKRRLAGEDNEGLRARPPLGAYAYDRKNKKLFYPESGFPSLPTLDVFGAIYADGTFDSLLDDGFHPFLQTQRGCPFACAYCHASDEYYSKVAFLSPEFFRKDIEYLAKRFSGRHEVVLYLANTNMGLFQEDFQIARIIREMQEKYDWPRHLNFNTAKIPQKILKMLNILKFPPTLSLQTLTAQVLKVINRKNIPFDDFVKFQRDVLEMTGEISSTELIVCLPEETRETFLETLKAVINSGVQDIVIFTLMNLKGTPLFSEEVAKKYGYLIRHRIVPRQFSVLRGEKIFDTEEVIVATNKMSFDDYLMVRGLFFTTTVFSAAMELIPLKRLLVEYGVDIARWIFGIHSRLERFPDLNGYFKEFMRETEEELFASRQALLDFLAKPENFQALCNGKLGDNLVRKYKYLALSGSFKSVLKLAICEAETLLGERLTGGKAEALLKSMELFLSTRGIQHIFKDPNVIMGQTRISLDYNIPDWIEKSGRLLEDFSGKYEYMAEFDKNVKEKINNYTHANKSGDLSLQVMYRDGFTQDFWPKWTLINEVR